MAIVGGALLPQFQGMIIDAGGTGVKDTMILGFSEINFSFILPLVCFLLISSYARWVMRNE
jgi:FHS family L-fucose permease-like MFS transporter